MDHRRIGKYVEATNAEDQKHRPIRLTFSSEAMRDEALKAFHRTRKEKLADPLTPKLSATLTLRNDLTPQERKEEDKLFEELKAKRQESERSGDRCAHWIMRHGRVMNIGHYSREGEGNK